jgi:hypothetical protein
MTLVQITIYLILTVLSPQEEVGTSLGFGTSTLAAHRDSFTRDPMAYAPIQRLSLAEKTPVPSFLLASSGWTHNLLRITHTWHTLQRSHVLGMLASKIALQSSLKASLQNVISNKSQSVPKSHFKFRSCYRLLPFATSCYFNPNSIPNSISTIELLPRVITDPYIDFIHVNRMNGSHNRPKVCQSVP